MKKKVLSILLSVAMVAAMVSGCGSKEEESAPAAEETEEAAEDTAEAGDETYEGEIKIGVVGPFSGSSAMVGDTEKKGVELECEMIIVDK